MLILARVTCEEESCSLEKSPGSAGGGSGWGDPTVVVSLGEKARWGSGRGLGSFLFLLLEETTRREGRGEVLLKCKRMFKQSNL